MLDLGQASEKAYAAMKLALREYVMELETTNSIKIIQSIDSWDARKYEKLIDLIESLVESELYTEILFGWNSAKK